MHEYGLMRDIVGRAAEECARHPGRSVTRLRVEVGEFMVASRESLEAAYEILARGTPLEGSFLEISEVPGRARCPACAFEGGAADIEEVSEPPSLLLCPRCGSPLLVTAGAGIALAELQLEDRGRPMAAGRVRGGR